MKKDQIVICGASGVGTSKLVKMDSENVTVVDNLDNVFYLQCMHHDKLPKSLVNNKSFQNIAPRGGKHNKRKHWESPYKV